MGVVGIPVTFVSQVYPRFEILAHLHRQFYAFILAVLATLSRVRQSAVVARHLNAVLLSSWAVYVYRDVWPLATVTLQPLDASQGPLFWARFALLTVAGVVIPLVIPLPYVPLDPAVSHTYMCV